MANTEENISKYIKSKSKGSLLFPDDFNYLDNSGITEDWERQIH